MELARIAATAQVPIVIQASCKPETNLLVNINIYIGKHYQQDPPTIVLTVPDEMAAAYKEQPITNRSSRGEVFVVVEWSRAGDGVSGREFSPPDDATLQVAKKRGTKRKRIPSL